jgi:diguanylate cyclase (GGDEF)-like protein/PAS domain S-box-containing protein
MAQRHTTIKAKLLLAVLPAVTILAIITVLLLTAYFRASTTKTIEKQQYSLVRLMAGKLDDQFDSYRTAISSFAKTVPLADLDNPAALERFLDNRQAIQGLFDNNVAIFSPEGTLLAEVAHRPSRTGHDFSYRDYIVKTRKIWQPTISAPFRSSLPHAPPVVMFTEPVFDATGKPVAIVGGSIDLLRPNLLGKLATTTIGETGYFYLTDQQRTMIMHPDRERILTLTAQPGTNKLYDRAVAGFEGAGETVNSRGVKMLIAYKRLASTGWILAAQVPSKEAYAPVVLAEQVGWGIALFALIFLAVLITVSASRLLAPLQYLSARITQIRSSEQMTLFPVTTNDEIGRLSSSFNSLLIQLSARERDLQNSRELYQFISDFSGDWIFWRMPSGEMLYISPAAEKISGYSVDELLADPLLTTSMVHPDDRCIWNDHLCQADMANSTESIEFRIITKQGTVRWLRHSCTPILDADGALIGVRGSNDDITEQKEALLTLQESEQRFRQIAKAAHDAIIMADQHQRITLWNPSAERLFGMSAETAFSLPLTSFIPGLFEAIEQEGDDAREGLRLELLGRTAGGTAMMLELSLSSARIAGEHHTLLLARDITERKMSEQQLKYLSLHDALTGLHNRAGFEHYREQMDTEGPFPVAIIMADLDGLKTVNDHLGHEAGDRMIAATAELLKAPFRAQDIIARIGGDEFALLLPGMDESVANLKLERLRRRIALHAELPDVPPVSLSLGMAFANGPGQLHEALNLADQQMYAEKQAKKDQPNS